MKLMHCPINGWRPIQEFSYGGTFRLMPPPQNCTDQQWANYVFNRDGAAGIIWPVEFGSLQNEILLQMKFSGLIYFRK